MTLSGFMLKEKIVRMTELGRNPGKTLKGFVRVVSDGRGLRTSGFFLDKSAFLDLLETLGYASPVFWDELEKSRKSGRVPAKEIEKRLRMK